MEWIVILKYSIRIEERLQCETNSTIAFHATLLTGSDEICGCFVMLLLGNQMVVRWLTRFWQTLFIISG